MAYAYGVWRMRMEYGACVWSMAHSNGNTADARSIAHDVCRICMEYVAYAWSMAHAHGVWRIMYGTFVLSMAYGHRVWKMRILHAHGVN